MTNTMQSSFRRRASAAFDVALAVALAALVFAALVALAVSVVPAAETPQSASAAPTPVAKPTPASIPAALAASNAFTITTDPRIVLVLELGNRLYPDWKETREVHLGEEFPIGDTEFSAVTTALEPDFRLQDGKPVSLSARLDNPAVHVLVRKGATATDSTWAFLNFPPHYSPRSFFTFQLQEVRGYAGPGATSKTATTTSASALPTTPAATPVDGKRTAAKPLGSGSE